MLEHENKYMQLKLSDHISKTILDTSEKPKLKLTRAGHLLGLPFFDTYAFLNPVYYVKCISGLILSFFLREFLVLLVHLDPLVLLVYL